jgi:regulator of cell morphogenesis and NO signaling
MTSHADMLLRDLANTGESVRRALERAGLDYCCKGGETLRRACECAGLDVSTVEKELGAGEVKPVSDWATRGVTALIDHIVGEVHPRTKQVLDELVAGRAALSDHDAPAREMREAVGLLVAHAQLQMSEDENVIFARARALAAARKGRGPYPAALRSMHDHRARLLEGHATTHEHLRRLRALAARLTGPGSEQVRARVDAVARAMTEQIHLENNELIPRVLDLEPNGLEVH